MFSLVYELLLMLSGIAMIVIGLAIRGQSVGSRILNVVVGLAYFAYGFYLLFLFTGDRYRVFIYAFILPILLIVRAVKARKEAREQAAAHQFAAQGHPGQPAQGWSAPEGQPGQYGQAPQTPQGYPAPPGYPASQGYPAQPGQPIPQGQYGHPQGQYGHPQGQPGHPTN